jgi:hypothetical protein
MRPKGYSHRHQSAIVQGLSPGDRSLRQMPLRGMRMCRCRATYDILHAHQHLASCYLKLSIVLLNPSRASTGIFSTPSAALILALEETSSSVSLRRHSGVSGKSQAASRGPKPYFFNINLYLTPKFTHLIAISSNTASKRSSPIEAINPTLNVPESHPALAAPTLYP